MTVKCNGHAFAQRGKDYPSCAGNGSQNSLHLPDLLLPSTAIFLKRICTENEAVSENSSASMDSNCLSGNLSHPEMNWSFEQSSYKQTAQRVAGNLSEAQDPFATSWDGENGGPPTSLSLSLASPLFSQYSRTLFSYIKKFFKKVMSFTPAADRMPDVLFLLGRSIRSCIIRFYRENISCNRVSAYLRWDISSLGLYMRLP